MIFFHLQPATTSSIEGLSRCLRVGIELTITSHLPEESGATSKNTAGSNVLGFVGGLALGLLPILFVVLFAISSFYSVASVPFESSQSLLFLSSILVVAGSIFAIVKRKFGLGVGMLVGFFSGLAVIIILAFLLMAYAISSVW